MKHDRCHSGNDDQEDYMDKFDGFKNGAFLFLEELSKNNNREWFDAHKSDYEGLIREPALRFIADMSKPLAKISEHYEAVPKKVGGSLMRIYRDIRFSPDKTPYKTNVGIQFRHRIGTDAHAPGFYLHLEVDECFLGVGTWRPPSDAVLNIRTLIAEESDRYCSIVDTIEKSTDFRRTGESLKRPPKGFAADHALIEEIKRKDFIMSASLERKDIADAEAVERIAERFVSASAYIEFLCSAIDMPF